MPYKIFDPPTPSGNIGYEIIWGERNARPNAGYFSDVMFLLNLACYKNTGYYLPCGDYARDWSYRLEDGKKKGVMKISRKLISKPFYCENYGGLETKIMRVNLLNELKGNFKVEDYRYSFQHLILPVLIGLKDAWINQFPNDNPYDDLAEFITNYETWERMLYSDDDTNYPTPTEIEDSCGWSMKNEKLKRLPLSRDARSWLSGIVEDFFTFGYEKNKLKNFRSLWSIKKYFYTIPQIAAPSGFWGEVRYTDKDWGTNHQYHQQHDLINITILPLLYSHRHSEFGKMFYNLFQKKGIIDFAPPPKSYKKIKKLINSVVNDGDIKMNRKRFLCQDKHKSWCWASHSRPLYLPSEDKNRDGSKEVIGVSTSGCNLCPLAKKLWYPYFIYRLYLNRVYFKHNSDRQLGSVIGYYTDRRRNYWSYIKENSTRLNISWIGDDIQYEDSEDKNYYNHRDYKQHYIQSLLNI